MKRQKDAEDLAARLTAGATAPLQMPVSGQQDESHPAKKRTKKPDVVPIHLRLPAALHGYLDQLAVERTKQGGRGVSVQQIIIEILEKSQ